MKGLIDADGALFLYEQALNVVNGNPDDHEWYSPSLNYYSDTKHKDSIRIKWLESSLHSAWIRHLGGVDGAIKILGEVTEDQTKYETLRDGIYDWIPIDGLRDAVAEYTDNEGHKYFLVLCADCGWEGSSKYIHTVPYDRESMSCHICQSHKVFDVEEFRLIEQKQEEIDVSAVAGFAFDMRIKLAKARRKGRSGWQTCEPQVFADMFVDHLFKNNDNNLIDLANLLMFFENRGGSTALLLQTICKRMIPLVSDGGGDTSALFLAVDVSGMPKDERQSYLTQLKDGLGQVSESINIPIIAVHPECQIYAISHNELTHSGIVLNRLDDEDTDQ